MTFPFSLVTSLDLFVVWPSTGVDLQQVWACYNLLPISKVLFGSHRLEILFGLHFLFGMLEIKIIFSVFIKLYKHSWKFERSRNGIGCFFKRKSCLFSKMSARKCIFWSVLQALKRKSITGRSLLNQWKIPHSIFHMWNWNIRNCFTCLSHVNPMLSTCVKRMRLNYMWNLNKWKI